ncbi:MAG: lysophospholipid acyltransferase family protein [Calditrichaeota bacterium]|nr:lysophospholipid acyltransferase family protein [Calditrichota bacterium]
MAKKHYMIPARLLRKLPALRKPSWLVEAFMVKSLGRLTMSMPLERAAGFNGVVFRKLSYCFQFTSRIRRNLSIAFPEKDQREIGQLTQNVCTHLGWAAVELVLAKRIWRERKQRVEFVVEEGIDLSHYRGRPAVLVTGHIGAWQITSFLTAQYKLRMTSIYAPEENPYLRDYFHRLRSNLPCHFISRDSCMRALTKELKQGHFVGLTSDTRLDGGVPVSFFGKSMLANTTAARLALLHNCDLFPIRAERLPGMRFRVTLCRAIRPKDEDAPMSEKARQMTEKLFGHFEAWIRDNPDQWMCYSRRWPQEAYTD